MTPSIPCSARKPLSTATNSGAKNGAGRGAEITTRVAMPSSLVACDRRSCAAHTVIPCLSRVPSRDVPQAVLSGLDVLQAVVEEANLRVVEQAHEIQVLGDVAHGQAQHLHALRPRDRGQKT